MEMDYFLMLEGDPDDRQITREMLEEVGIQVNIRFVSTSEEVFRSLRQARPKLLLIDWNSAPDSGLDVLKKIRSEPAYASLPVVILGEQTPPDMVALCYAHGASSFVQKPLTPQQTREKIKAFFYYWLHVAQV